MNMQEMKMKAPGSDTQDAAARDPLSLLVIALIMITAILLLAANMREAASNIGWW